MEVKTDPGHQRPAGRPPPRRVAVAGVNANACETACNGVLRSGLRLTAARVPWNRHHPLRRGDLTTLPRHLAAAPERNPEMCARCVAIVWEGARESLLRPLVRTRGSLRPANRPGNPSRGELN